MKITTHWARDEEYHYPHFRHVARRTIGIHESTGQQKLDPNNGQYIDGLYWSRQWEYAWAVQQAEPQKGARVLDVGCGTAPFLIYLGQIGCKAYGSDPGNKGPDGLWGNEDGFGAPHVIEIRKEPMSALSWEDNSFDTVFCISVLEHIESPKELESGIEEMARVLKLGGRLIITMDEIGVGVRKAMLTIGVFTAGGKFIGYFDREYPATRHPYHILGMVLEK